MITRPTVFLAALLLAACASFTAPRYESLDRGEPVPANEVLVIGNFELDPPVRQGQLSGIARGGLKDVVHIAMTNDLSQKVDLNSLVFVSPDEIFTAKYGAISFVPMPPGERFIRMGHFYITVIPPVMNQSGVGPTMVSPGKTEDLQLVADLKVRVPANARAVYIGTIVFKHDGARATGVYVRDDYKNAARELNRLNIPGVNAKSMRKQLARVIRG